MTLASHIFYGREADRLDAGLVLTRDKAAQARTPSVYGGDAATAALRCFRRYSPNAHVDVIEGRWTTNKQTRVYAIAKRMEATGEAMTMRAMAIEAQVVPSTVSRALLKFQAWGLIAVDVTRGKYGGVRVYRVAAHVLKAYIAAAKAKLRDLWRRRIAGIEGRSNVAFTKEQGGNEAESATTSRGRNIRFADQVIYARAYLAIEDPDGEAGAVHPLYPELARRNIAVGPLPEREINPDEDIAVLRARKMRDAGLMGDWREWERLRGAELWGL